MSAKPRTTTAVRFPPELHEQLTTAAEERGLSVNYLVNEAVREFLPRLIPAGEWRLTR
jgi:predicted HicB family RNase H-like nuclease